MEFSQFVMRSPLRTHPHNYCVLFSNFICISSSKFHDKRWKNQTCCVKYMKLNWIIYGIIWRPMKGPDRLYTWTHMDGMHNILIAIVIFDFIMSKTFACKLCVCVCEQAFGSIFSVQLKLVRALYACFRNDFMARTLLQIDVPIKFWFFDMPAWHAATYW